MKLDLHIHSTYSDGAYTPEMLIDTAAAAGVNVMAITDHDNVLSHDIAKNYIKEKGLDIEIIPGVEINTIYNNEEIHILGYFMNFENKDFKNMLKEQQQARVKQTHKIVELLNKKANIPVTFQQINNYVAKGGSIGRPHIAKAIVVAGGAQNVMQAYAKYINDESEVYIQRETVTPHDAVEIIYEAGGIPVVAHPCDIANPEKLVLDLSCKKTEHGYVIATDRWQKLSHITITDALMEELSEYCDEFLIHAVDVEGKSEGIEEDLVTMLSSFDTLPITYAGGIRSVEDIELLKDRGNGKINFTIGSALSIFGGNLDMEDVLRI